MNYEIVHLKEKTVVGLTARTNNLAPDMGTVIGGIWHKFYEDGIYAAIPNKSNERTLGIYTDYAGDEKDDYTFMAACEVDNCEADLEGTVKRTLPTGTYAKFIVKGNLHQAVGKFWQELWNMNLARTFVCDFEEYVNSDLEHAEIHIYIGIK